MSIYFVDQPSRRLKIRAPVKLEISREDTSYVFPYITDHFMDVMMLIPSEGASSSPEYSGIYKCDRKEIAEVIEQLVRSYARKLMFLGALHQNVKYVNPSKAGEVVPFTGRIKALPTVLFPLPFPLAPFRDSVKYMPSLVRFIDNISCNVEWLTKNLEPLRGVDNFTSKMADIAREVYLSGKRYIRDDIRAYICRADYLLNVATLQSSGQGHSYVNTAEHCRVCHYDICLCELRTVVGGYIGSYSDLSKGFELLPGVSMKMVEINTVSCALAHAAGVVARAHSDSVECMLRSRLSMGKMDHVSMVSAFRKLHLQNTPLGGIVDTLATAHEHYVKRHCSVIDDSPPCILEVVTEDLANFFDVYAVADTLFENYGIMVKVVTMRDLCQLKREGRLFVKSSSEPPTRVLVPTNQGSGGMEHQAGRLYYATAPLNHNTNNDVIITEVSVIYYRTCYEESQMDCDRDSWDVRLMCELADAVKVPSIPTQLAGSKRIQLLLSGATDCEALLGDEVVSHEQSPSGARIMSTEETLATFKSVNVLQVDPSLPSSQTVVQDAVKNPENYVLKTQAEGGSGLLVGEELVEVLKQGLSGDTASLSKYVLMKKINSPLQKAVFVKSDENGAFRPTVERTITELGIYGCAVVSGKRVLMEECSGYLSRTKAHSCAAGGVCAGHSSVSSLLFF